jgi:glycerophosphoryl diester phosphodiesterase
MRTVLTFTLVWVLSQLAAAAERQFEFFQPLVPPRSFQLMAPGGMAGQAPRNTRQAMTLAIEDGLEWVAVDVWLSKDAQHVLFSEGDLADQSNGSLSAKDRTAYELTRLDAGSWFAKRFAGAKLMTLAEFFTLVRGRINACLNCKDVDPKLLVSQIKAANVASQVLVHAEPDTLSRVREASGGTIALMTTWRPADGFGKWLDALKPAVVEIDADQMTPEICRQFHARGIQVEGKLLGKSDNSKSWDKALSDGADFLQTSVAEEVVVHVLDQQLKPRPVRFACHRGASRYAPENTLPAFEKAYRLHADFVEFDVRRSDDKNFFLMHDTRLDRTTSGKGIIRQTPTAAIEALDAGAWFGRPFVGTRVPSLDKFLASVPRGVGLYFDAKDITADAAARALDKYSLSDRAIVYQSAGYLEDIKQADSRIRALPPASSKSQVTSLAAGIRPYAVDTRWTALTKDFIDHCHAAGIQVFADAPAETDVKGYRQAIEWGIDLIQTDHPLRVWRAMELVFAARAKG